MIRREEVQHQSSMPKRDRAIEKYLTQFAEPEISDLTIEGTFDTALVIPAFREDAPTIRQQLGSLPDNCLPILVINAPSEDASTLTLLSAIEAMLKIKGGRYWSLRDSGQRKPLLMFEYCLAGHYLPAKQGVGLARKVGVDAALKLYRQGVLRSDRIYLTDADAVLPRDYFSSPWPAQASAVVFPYLHRLSGSHDAQRATLLFECRLRHYESGLRYAESRYAYPTLGSLIGVRANAYAEVRGVPKRAAAEDFYLLNKLAKVGQVIPLKSRPIKLANRPSERVPIGTGPSLVHLAHMLAQGEMPRFYSPQSFKSLKQLLCTLQMLEQPDHVLQIPDDAVQHFLQETDFVGTINRLRKTARERSRFQQSIVEWFDGFRQLKFIHFLRDYHHPLVTLEEALRAPWFSDGSRGGFSRFRFRALQDLATAPSSSALDSH